MQLLVVCRANIARSPLAEVLLADALAGRGIEVASAGVRATTGAPPARGSVELAARRDLDLTGHRSRPVTDVMVREAALVLSMSQAQRDVCARLGPGASQRCFTLREFDRLTADLDPPDGPGGPLPALVSAAHLARPASRPPTAPEDIPDPIGADWEEWIRLADELEQLAARLSRRLADDHDATSFPP